MFAANAVPLEPVEPDVRVCNQGYDIRNLKTAEVSNMATAAEARSLRRE